MEQDGADHLASRKALPESSRGTCDLVGEMLRADEEEVPSERDEQRWPLRVTELFDPVIAELRVDPGNLSLIVNGSVPPTALFPSPTRQQSPSPRCSVDEPSVQC